MGEVVERGQQQALGEVAEAPKMKKVEAGAGAASGASTFWPRTTVSLPMERLPAAYLDLNSVWPPNWKRMAESSFSPKVWSWRERKRV